MEMRQTAQGEALMGVSMEAGGRASPADHRGRYRCAVALSVVMTLFALALGICFVLGLFVISRQENPPLTPDGKVYQCIKLKESKEKGRYDIFTVNKGANYFIYGWVKFSDVSGEEVTVTHTVGEHSDQHFIQKMKVKTDEKQIFFNSSLLITDGSRISIYFKSVLMDSLFHMYEL